MDIKSDLLLLSQSLKSLQSSFLLSIVLLGSPTIYCMCIFQVITDKHLLLWPKYTFNNGKGTSTSRTFLYSSAADMLLRLVLNNQHQCYEQKHDIDKCIEDNVHIRKTRLWSHWTLYKAGQQIRHLMKCLLHSNLIPAWYLIL